MAHEYLLKEYELCFEQVRFYDTRQESLLKYTITLTSAVATALFAVYQFLQGATAKFFECEAILSGLVFIGTVMLFLAMLQNRLYFVFTARQLNAIRGYLMRVGAGTFKNNQLFTSTQFAALKPMSVHTLELLCTALISSLFAGASALGIGSAGGSSPSISLAVVASILIFVSEAAFGIGYLRVQGPKTADEAIHLERAENHTN